MLVTFIAPFLFCAAYASADIKVTTSTQVSIGVGGQVPAGSSGSPVIAPNGQFALFNSGANNLVSNDTNLADDVFLTSLKTGVVTRISVNQSGVQGDGDSRKPAISVIGANGFFAAAFESDSTNLGHSTDSNGFTDIYLRIPSLNITERVSRGINDLSPDANSSSPDVAYLSTANKIRVVFASDATNLAASDQNNDRDIFLAELTVPKSNSYDESNFITVSRITNGPAGTGANGDSDTPKLSGSGEFIVFSSSASNLISGVSGNKKQIYLYKISTGAFTLISKASDGTAGDGNSTAPSVSYNGRYISYVTNSSNIISGLPSSKKQVIRFDTKTGISALVSSNESQVAGDNDAKDATISSNGRVVTISDTSTNLVSATDTNGSSDVFLKDIDTGGIARISTSITGGVADDASDSTFTAATSFNSLSSLVFFRSFATNLTNNNLASGAGDTFLNSADLSPIALTKRTGLEVPADVVPGRKKATITAQKFSGFSTRGFPKRKSSVSLRYEIHISSVKAKVKTRITVITKRNKVTVKKLKPGTYVTQYKVVAQKGSTTVTKTPFSPKVQFSVS